MNTAAIHPLHEDAALLVVDKPAGLLSVPGRGADKADCLAVRVQAQWPDALVVHRLDMATSGLVAFGRGAAAQRALSMAFAARAASKRYEAVVHGLPQSGEAPAADGWHTIDAPLASDWPNRPRWHVVAGGKPSTTRWRPIGPGPAPGTHRLALEPVTGRTHQLRVHLAHAGSPIVGDVLYGPAGSTVAGRMLLHATGLGLPHPVSGAWMGFESPAPF